MSTDANMRSCALRLLAKASETHDRGWSDHMRTVFLNDNEVIKELVQLISSEDPLARNSALKLIRHSVTPKTFEQVVQMLSNLIRENRPEAPIDDYVVTLLGVTTDNNQACADILITLVLRQDLKQSTLDLVGERLFEKDSLDFQLTVRCAIMAIALNSRVNSSILNKAFCYLIRNSTRMKMDEEPFSDEYLNMFIELGNEIEEPKIREVTSLSSLGGEKSSLLRYLSNTLYDEFLKVDPSSSILTTYSAILLIQLQTLNVETPKCDGALLLGSRSPALRVIGQWMLADLPAQDLCF